MCLVKRALVDGITHSFAHIHIQSAGNVENPLCVRHPPQDVGRRWGWMKHIGSHGGEEAHRGKHSATGREGEKPSDREVETVVINNKIAG